MSIEGGKFNLAGIPPKPDKEGEKVEINWQPYFAQPPKRSDIDPDRTLSKQELAERIDTYFAEQGIDAQAMGSINISEYPELVDEGIQSLCQKINALPFVRTYSSCEGHPIEVNLEQNIQSSEVGRVEQNLEYVEPNLSLLFDPSDERSAYVITSLKKIAADLTEKHPQLKIALNEESRDSVVQIDCNLNLQVPNAWIEQHGRQSPVELDQIIAQKRIEMNVVDPPEETNFKSKQEYHKALEEWQSQHEQAYEQWENKYHFGLYWNEYGDYFESKEARSTIRSFFDEIDTLVSQP